nr:DUF2156 domain-containing protein [Clostridium caldaquaticum]
MTLDDKKLFDTYLKPYKFLTSEYSFTNLFIWRKALDIQYTVYKDALIIKKKDFSDNYHFMQPIGYNREFLTQILDILINYRKEFGLKYLFKDCETPFIEELKSIYGENLSYEEDRDNFDYIYESSKLISLSGKKLHSKKNHYNHFVKNNIYNVVPINEENINECMKAACEWCNRIGCKGYVKHELKSIQELLINREKLDFVGIAIYVNNILSAFTIGEKMNANMAIIHIEKADTNINGLYTFINKTFVETCFKDVPYINREQDLGIEGLRKAKLSYQPFKLEHKYAVL